jgi:hypothetical protein
VLWLLLLWQVLWLLLLWQVLWLLLLRLLLFVLGLEVAERRLLRHLLLLMPKKNAGFKPKPKRKMKEDAGVPEVPKEGNPKGEEGNPKGKVVVPKGEVVDPKGEEVVPKGEEKHRKPH